MCARVIARSRAEYLTPSRCLKEYPALVDHDQDRRERSEDGERVPSTMWASRRAPRASRARVQLRHGAGLNDDAAPGKRSRNAPRARSERYLWHQDRPLAARQDLRDELEIDLGLAASGDAESKLTPNFSSRRAERPDFHLIRRELVRANECGSEGVAAIGATSPLRCCVSAASRSPACAPDPTPKRVLREQCQQRRKRRRGRHRRERFGSRGCQRVAFGASEMGGRCVCAVHATATTSPRGR